MTRRRAPKVSSPREERESTMRVYECLLNAAEEAPEKTAIEFMGNPISYGALAEQSRRIASGLRQLGIGPGDSVGLMLPNLPQFVSSLYGAFLTGSVVVPLNVLLTPPEIKYLVEDSDIRLIFVYEMFVPQMVKAIADVADPPKLVIIGKDAADHIPFEQLAAAEVSTDHHPVERDTPVLTIYTSGTTGKPKGAIITNHNVISNLEMTDEIFKASDDDKFLCVLPLFHVFALNGILNASIRNKGTVVLHPKFDVEDTVNSLMNDGITRFAGVPTMYFYILKHPEVSTLKFPDLRMCLSGGAAMPVEVMKEFEKMFGVDIYEGFGLTETTVSVSCNRPGGVRKPGSVGPALPNVQIKIVNEEGEEVPAGELGELIVKAPNVMKGYLNKPEATAEAIKDGWFYTGDIGHRDEDSYFYIVDRKKDMIIKGGENIVPAEVENVLYTHPGVAEAAVVGVPHDVYGEDVLAFVVKAAGCDPSEEEIIEHVKKEISRFKAPSRIEFIAALPKSGVGKILRRELRDMAATQK